MCASICTENGHQTGKTERTAIPGQIAAMKTVCDSVHNWSMVLDECSVFRKDREDKFGHLYSLGYHDCGMIQLI